MADDDDAADAAEANEERSKEVRATSGSKSDQADTTATLEPLAHASAQDWLGSNQDPDVLLAIPNLGVDHIGLVVEDLQAHVELHAKVLDLVELHVGADVAIKKVDLQIDNVRVQAMLKVRLDKVREIVGDVVQFLDNNPEVLTNLTGGLGKGLEGALSQGSVSGDDNGGQKEIEGRSNVSYDQQDQQDEQDQQAQDEADTNQKETDRERRAKQRDERRQRRRAEGR